MKILRENGAFGGFDRREFLKIGGLGVAGYALLPKFISSKVRAEGSIVPLNTADATIFIALRGGPSHMDTFSVKGGYWTPDDWQITTNNGMTLPARIFPRLLQNQSRNFSIIHAMQGTVPIHEAGQYTNDTAQDLNAALVAERPAMGAVIAMEYQSRRGPDDVFPAFFSLAQSGLRANNGFFSGLDAYFPIPGGSTGSGRLIPTSGLGSLTNPLGQTRFETFWNTLLAIDAPQRSSDPLWGKPVSDFNDFYTAAKTMMYNSDVQAAFTYPDADRASYGGTPFGDSLLVAKKLIQANKGVRFVHVGFNAWDNHVDIYPNLRNFGPVLDYGLDGLMTDLSNTPSPTTPGQTMLDRTLIVMLGEFGRTPPNRYTGTTGLNNTAGRDHYALVQFAFLAGGGVRGGRNIGRLDDFGSAILDSEWHNRDRRGVAGPNIRMQDIAATIYSAMNINWTREIWDTPSRRVYQYVDGGPNTQYDPATDLFT